MENPKVIKHNKQRRDRNPQNKQDHMLLFTVNKDINGRIAVEFEHYQFLVDQLLGLNVFLFFILCGCMQTVFSVYVLYMNNDHTFSIQVTIAITLL